MPRSSAVRTSDARGGRAAAHASSGGAHWPGRGSAGGAGASARGAAGGAGSEAPPINYRRRRRRRRRQEESDDEEEVIPTGPFNLWDVLPFMAEEGYVDEANKCMGLCKATLSDTLLTDVLVNQAHGRWQRTRLMYAAWRGNLKRLEFLLGCGADVNAAAKVHGTALDHAVRAGHAAVVKALVFHPRIELK